MTVPYDLYVRYLATCGSDDVKEVNKHLEKTGLRPITQAELDPHWELFGNILPQRVIESIGRKSYTPEFLKHMKVLEVEELWRADPKFKDKNAQSAVKQVYEVFQDAQLRITLNALLIKRLKIEEISRLVITKFSIHLTEKHIDLYERFFWNSRRMTRGDWREYLKRCGDKEKKIYFTAMTEPPEVLKTELDLPSLANVGDSLQWLFTKSFLKARALMDIGTPEADRSAVMWSDQVVKLADKYEKYRSGDQNDFGKTLQLEFDFIDEKFDTPDDETYNEVAKKAAPKES